MRVMAASCLETFKEAAESLDRADRRIGSQLLDTEISEPRIVGRRYRVISGGQPVIIITEYFLRNDIPRCFVR